MQNYDEETQLFGQRLFSVKRFSFLRKARGQKEMLSLFVNHRQISLSRGVVREEY